jgi:hypothetical protein
LDANEPGGIGQVNPGRRTAMARLQGEPHLLFLYHVAGAIREPAAAFAFWPGVCGKHHWTRPIDMIAGALRGNRRAVRSGAKSTQIHQRFLNAN